MNPDVNGCNPAENVWSRREELPKVSAVYLAVAAVLCFLSALALPFGGSELLSLISIPILLGLLVWMVRSPFGPILAAVSAFFAITVTASFGTVFGGGAIFLSLMLGCASCTYLLTVLRRRYLALLPPVAAAAVAYFLLSDPKGCLLCLAFLPAAALLTYATLSERRRTSAICFAAGGFLLTLLILLAFLVFRAYGDLSGAAITQYFTDLRERFLALLMEQREAWFAALEATGAELPETMQAEVAELLSEETLATLVNQVFHLLPALALVACSILAFESQAVLNACYRASGLSAVVTRTARVFTVSIPAAVLYSLSFLLQLFLAPDSMASAVVQNLCLLLMPGLCVLGVIRLWALISNARGPMKVLLILFAASMLFCYPGGALYILAMWGAYSDIAGALHLFMIKKMVDRENGNDRDDDDRKDD